jgi:hypothetical protein
VATSGNPDGEARVGDDAVYMALTSPISLRIVRYGLPVGLIVAGFVILIVVDDVIRWDGWAMCVGSGLALFALNWCFRLGASGDRDRDAEEAARDYFSAHGRWPDED